MTLDPEPAELAPSRDPAAYGRKRLFGFGFWAMMVLCLAFLAGGYVIAKFGPQLFPVRAQRTQAPSAPGRVQNPQPGAWTAANGPGYPAIPAQVPPGQGPIRLGPALAGGGGATMAGSPEEASLAQRVVRLESAEDAVVNAAAAALAVSQLSQASQGSRPFANELAAVQALTPYSPNALALMPLAQTGAPSRAALAQAFAAQIQPVAIALRAPGPQAGILAHIGYALSTVVTVRRIGPDERGREAALSRIESLVRDGDLEGALAAIDMLPGAARDQLAPWRARAERRLEIDHRVEGVRAEALARLRSLSQGGGG